MCHPDPDNFFTDVSLPALPPDEAPFLNAIFFLMLNRDLTPLALAQSLARARFGYWADDRRTFFYTRLSHGPRPSNQVGYKDQGSSGFGIGNSHFQRFSHNLVLVYTSMVLHSLQTRTAFYGREV
jgi:hypothetical protein